MLDCGANSRRISRICKVLKTKGIDLYADLTLWVWYEILMKSGKEPHTISI